jgi:hypothetical protein
MEKEREREREMTSVFREQTLATRVFEQREKETRRASATANYDWI